MTSEIITSDASALIADVSCIDVSEAQNEKQKAILLRTGKEIREILITAALDIGEKVVYIQDEVGVGLYKYYKSIGISNSIAQQCACTYRLFVDHVIRFDGDEETVELFSSMNKRVAQQIWSLPAKEKSEMQERIKQGEMPSQAEVAEIANKPEVKLSRAEELLAAARTRKADAEANWEMTKADPAIGSKTAEYKNAQKSISNAETSIQSWEQQVADLKAQIEEEKLRTAEESEEKARVEKELQKLKFDDASARAERVKRVSSTLTLSIPQTLADVQKFFAEVNDYPEEVRKHIIEQSTLLANYIGDKL